MSEEVNASCYRVYKGIPPSHEDTKTLTGYLPYVVLKLWTAIAARSKKDRIEYPWVIAALATAHLNVTYEALCLALNGAMHGCATSTTTVRRRIMEVLEHSRCPVLDPIIRFEFLEPEFPHCTFMVDGTPVYCRGDSTMFSPKHGSKAWSVQVFYTMNRIPLAWQPFVSGVTHDALSLGDAGAYFPHLVSEMGLGDTAYIGNAHMLCPFKAVAKQKMPKEASSLEQAIRLVRNRAENGMSLFDKHRFMHYCQFTKETAEGLFGLVFSAEQLYQYYRPDRDSLWPSCQLLQADALKQRMQGGKKCTCNCSTIDAVKFEADIFKHRDDLANFFHSKFSTTPPTKKASAHRSKKDPAVKPQRSQEEEKQSRKEKKKATRAAKQLMSQQRAKQKGEARVKHRTDALQAEIQATMLAGVAKKLTKTQVKTQVAELEKAKKKVDRKAPVSSIMTKAPEAKAKPAAKGGRTRPKQAPKPKPAPKARKRRRGSSDDDTEDSSSDDSSSDEDTSSSSSDEETSSDESF